MCSDNFCSTEVLVAWTRKQISRAVRACQGQPNYEWAHRLMIWTMAFAILETT